MVGTRKTRGGRMHRAGTKRRMKRSGGSYRTKRSGGSYKRITRRRGRVGKKGGQRGGAEPTPADTIKAALAK